MEKIISLNNYMNKLSDLFIVKLSDKKIKTKVDNNIYYNLGKFLMLLYIGQIKNSSRRNISYKDNIIYIKQVSSYSNNNLDTDSSSNIVDKLINKSVYNIEFIPEEIGDINKKDILKVIKGFKDSYNLFLEEKLKIIDFLYSYEKEMDYLDLINFINILNPKDLDMQIKLLLLRYTGKISSNIISKRKNKLKCLDEYINSGIIGVGEYGLELMWIEYYNGKLQCTEYRNVYISLLLAFIGKKSENKYYLKSAEYCVNPIISYLKEKKEIEKIDEYELISILYLLNDLLEDKDLDNFIIEHPEIFSIPKVEKEKKYLNIKKSIEVLKGIII